MSGLRYTLLLAGACVATGAYAQQLGKEHWKTLEQYCSKCHNASDFAGGFAIGEPIEAPIPVCVKFVK